MTENAPTTGRDRKLLMQRVQELGTTEHEEIFKILKMQGVEYSANKNGVFVNLTNITDDVFRLLNNFVTFCMDNKATLDEYDKAIIDRKYQSTNSGGYATAPPPPQPPTSDPQLPEGASSSSSIQSPLLGALREPAVDAPPDSHTCGKGGVGFLGIPASAMPSTMKAIRRDNSKFNQAKKRYAKKRSLVANNETATTTKKGEAAMDLIGNNLSVEPFLISFYPLPKGAAAKA